MLSSLHTCTLTHTEKHTPITIERSTVLTAYTMSHAEDASSVPGMYAWQLPTSCKQPQQIQLLVLASTGTCCACVAYTHIDAYTYMQIRQQENPPKSTSQNAVWRVFVDGAVSMLSHFALYLCFLWSSEREGPHLTLLRCVILSGIWKFCLMGSKNYLSSISWGWNHG